MLSTKENVLANRLHFLPSFYLIIAIVNPNYDYYLADVHALLKVLASSMSLERASALQKEFGKLLQDIDAHMHVTFIPPTEEYLAKKKAAEEAKAERKKLVRQNQANAHLMSRHDEAVAQAQVSQLEEIAEQEIAEIYGEPPIMSKDAWDVDLV